MYFEYRKQQLPSLLYLVVLILIGVQTIWGNWGEEAHQVVRYGNYWEHHGLFLLFFLAVTPRLALLFSSIASGGFLWWLGWLVAPRLLIAILATTHYLESNPILVFIAWFIALSGEFSEKEFVRNRSTTYFYYSSRSRGSRVHSEGIEQNRVFEAEFKDLN